MTTTTEGTLLFEIRCNKDFGRYLVANQDIDARALILQEGPVACGPADDDQDMVVGDVPMCLGCFARMTFIPWTRCSVCGWPVCSNQCQQINLHAEFECKLFVQNHVAYPPRHTWPIINKSILVLRCLLIKEKCSADWNEVIWALEHHTDVRHSKPYCVKGDEMIINNIMEFFGLTYCPDTAMIDKLKREVVRVSGVININAFSTSNLHSRHASPGSTSIVQCIFRNACLLAHSCVPNATWRITGASPNLEISIRSTVTIRKGDMITIAYSSQDNLYGTLQRQISNEDVAHFICNCFRCKDPTELGTFISAIKCLSCELNYLLPIHPLNPDSNWTCLGCSIQVYVQKAVLVLHTVERKFDRIKTSGFKREEEVMQLEKLLGIETLHRNHYILQEIRMRILRRQVDFLDILTEDELARYTDHSKCLLEIADILTPGFCQARALLQYFLAQGLMEKLNRGSYPTTITDADRKIETEKLHKWIHALQSRALLFFNSITSNSQCDYIKSVIQKQLTQLNKIVM